MAELKKHTSPNQTEIDVAQKILNTLPFEPLYARVDLLKGQRWPVKADRTRND